MKGWQYKFLKLEINQVANERKFEQFGLDGWELIATYSTSCGSRINSTAIFKKPLNGVKKTIEEKNELENEETIQEELALKVPVIAEPVSNEPAVMEPSQTEPAPESAPAAEPIPAESASSRVKFGTLEWYQKLADWLNKDSDWLKGGLTTSFMYVYTDIMDSDGQPKAFLMKFDEGKASVTEGKAVDLSSKEIEFGSTATYAMHAGIAKGEINPQKAKLKIAMGKALKNQGTLKRQAVGMKEISSETEF